MTCIVGLVDDSKVWIGGDSASADGWTVRASNYPKVFRVGEFVLGFTTSWRMGQILQYHLSIEPQNEHQEDFAYMTRVFIEAVRSCLKEFGFTKVENNKEEGGAFLVGYRNRLYSINSDFQVGEMADGFDAVGCGSEFALGALAALEDLPARKRVERALEISAKFSGGVCPPFVILDS
jgi:ATP-dependent protease HslVU (ClpYQ) peptidase subunit